MKIKLKFKTYTSMTANSDQLSKDVRVVPDFDSLRLTKEDVEKCTDKAVKSLSAYMLAKRRRSID